MVGKRRAGGEIRITAVVAGGMDLYLFFMQSANNASSYERRRKKNVLQTVAAEKTIIIAFLHPSMARGDTGVS